MRVIPILAAVAWLITPGACGVADELKLIAWNVESGTPRADDPAEGSDPETIAEQLQGLTEYDIVGLSEVRPSAVDLSGAKLVDHSVMEKLHEMEQEFSQAGLHFDVIGLEGHVQFSAHPHAARKKRGPAMRRLTIVAAADLEQVLSENLLLLGARACMCTPCRAHERPDHDDETTAADQRIRLEALAPPAACEQMLAWLRREIVARHRVLVCIDPVDMLRQEPLMRLQTAGDENAATADAPLQAAH